MFACSARPGVHRATSTLAAQHDRAGRRLSSHTHKFARVTAWTGLVQANDDDDDDNCNWSRFIISLVAVVPHPTAVVQGGSVPGVATVDAATDERTVVVRCGRRGRRRRAATMTNAIAIKACTRARSAQTFDRIVARRKHDVQLRARSCTKLSRGQRQAPHFLTPRISVLNMSPCVCTWRLSSANALRVSMSIDNNPCTTCKHVLAHV